MTMDDEWGRPTEVTGEYARPAELKGHLLIVFPLGYVPEISTQFGLSDGIAVDVVDLDDKNEHGLPGKVYRSSNFMQAQLIASLKNQIGSKILGVMGQGVGKIGRNPPWVIIDKSGDPVARDRAAAWKQANPDFRPSSFAKWEPPAQQQPAQQVQQPRQQQAQQAPRQSTGSAILDSMSMTPVAGSAPLSGEEQKLLAQFRERQRQAQQQDQWEDQAPF